MKDRMGREIDYMRFSITDRCNLRCKYCMPEGIDCMPRWDVLSLEEFEDHCHCGSIIRDQKDQSYRWRATGKEKLPSVSKDA